MKPTSIGDVQVSSVIERDGPWRRPAQMFPTVPAHDMHRRLLMLEPHVYDRDSDLLVITYQTFVVRTPHHVILIDTCSGEHKSGLGDKLAFPRQPWLDGFAAQGLRFEDIDYVFCTHLHFDHCGWNTRLDNGRWVPTFPNARYVFSRREYEHWAAESARGEDPPGAVWRESCLPVVEAGQALLVDDDYALDDQVWLTPSNGHSPGHVCVHVASGGSHGVFTGDLMHHAVQCLEPDWSTCFCLDPAAAAVSRRALLEEAAEENLLVVPAHFPGSTVGHVVREAAGFRFRFSS